MFDETKKYQETGHFFLKADGDLETSCNASKSGNGVFIVNQLKVYRVWSQDIYGLERVVKANGPAV